MQFTTRKRRKVLINITSLIDVMFMLLVFLMISSTFLDQPGIKLELPSAQSSVVVEQKDYVLFVDKAGKMFLNNNGIALDNLEAGIKDALPNMKDSALILKADQDVSHGAVVKIMDIVRKSGVKKLIIGTKSQK
ncbi:MAG TPA: biopolymer transporter ExbD [Candidatus Kapabacteria bacterium]|nr:biopolymer transporter ExbD [Candidatus Kapabacteria bacterium]